MPRQSRPRPVRRLRWARVAIAGLPLLLAPVAGAAIAWGHWPATARVAPAVRRAHGHGQAAVAGGWQQPVPGGPGDFAADALSSLYDPPTFAEPTVDERLDMLYNLIAAYNREAIPHGFEADGVLIVDPIPTATQLQAWAERLPLARRRKIDYRLETRDEYTARFRGQQEVGETSAFGLMVNSDVRCPRSMADLFVSPRDGRPFLIGHGAGGAVGRLDDDNYELVIVEAEGRHGERQGITIRRGIATVGERRDEAELASDW